MDTVVKKTQTERILDLLADGQWHSSLEMRNELYIMQPATRIFEIKEYYKTYGENPIETRMMTANPQRADSPKIAWYRNNLFIKSIQQELLKCAD